MVSFPKLVNFTTTGISQFQKICISATELKNQSSTVTALWLVFYIKSTGRINQTFTVPLLTYRNILFED